MNGTEENKAGVRNFTFLKSADDRLLELADLTGKTMTKVLEDLLLGKRQFGPGLEKFIQSEVGRTGHDRALIIETALTFYANSTSARELLASLLNRRRSKRQQSQSVREQGAPDQSGKGR